MSGTTYDEPAGSLEEACGVVIVEELLGVQVARIRQRPGIDDCSCRVSHLPCAAVDAIRVRRQRRYALGSFESEHQSQRIFLVAATPPTSMANGHGKLATADDGNTAAGGLGL